MELQVIQNRIYEIRGCKVMLDFDLAELYQVETKYLKRAVRNNIQRFPDDFMFELTENEWKFLRCNFCTSKIQNDLRTEKRGGNRYLPFAFTEQGVAQLSSVLGSPYAIEVNIGIIRAFVAIRTCLYEHVSVSKEIADLWKQIKMLELQGEENLKAVNDLSEDAQNNFDDIYIALAELANKRKQEKPRPVVGFKMNDTLESQ